MRIIQYDPHGLCFSFTVKQNILEAIHELKSTELEIFCGAKIFNLISQFAEARIIDDYIDLAGFYIPYQLDLELKSTELFIQNENGRKLKLVE
jgi:hypothetical protein